jgi:hypothetical protein
MPPSQWLVGFSGVASIVGAIVTGCGGNATKATAEEAGSEAGSGNSTGSESDSSSGASSGSSLVGSGGSGAGSGSGDLAGPPDCGPLADVSVATYDSGNPRWACYQQQCAAEFARCSTEACCNNTILTAIRCVGLGGSNNICFTPAIGGAMDPDATGCILSVFYGPTCNPSEGGGDDGSTTDARDSGALDASGGQ